MNKWAYKWQVAASVIFGSFMVIMDATVVNVALPKLQTVFDTGNLSDVQWIISSYTLALGIVTPLSGFLADKFGIKRVYLFSLGAFTFGSLLCAIAPNLMFLIIARVLQGLGGGSVIPLGTALLFGAFPKEERGAAFGIFGISLVAAPALGPIISGLCVEYLDWRVIFLINIPIGIFGVIMGSRLLKESKGQGKQRFDAVGVFTSVVAFGLILYAFSIVEREGWGSTQVIVTLGIGLVGLAAFIISQLRRKDGLVDLRLFRNPIFIVGNVIGWVSVISLFGAEFLLPLYLQTLRGLSAVDTGLLLLPLALTAGLVVPFAGRFSDKIGPRPFAVIGFSLLLFNTWQLSSLTMDTNLFYIGVLLAIRGAALGMVVQVTQQVALRDIAPQALPKASALVNSSRSIFQSLGVAILATILAAGAGSQPNFSSGTQPNPEAINAFKESFLRGLENAYQATFWVCLVALTLSFFLPGWPMKKAQQVPAETMPTMLRQADKEKSQKVA